MWPPKPADRAWSSPMVPCEPEPWWTSSASVDLPEPPRIQLRRDDRPAPQDLVDDETRGGRTRRDPPAPCPAQMNRPRRPGTCPMSGLPSALCGRAQARVPRIGASAMPGTNVAALRSIGSIHAAGSGRRARNVEPTDGDPGERHEAEIHAGPHRRRAGVRSGCRSPPRSRPPRGRATARGEFRLDDDAPPLADRGPAAARIDERGRPRSGRDEDRIAGVPLAHRR